MGVLVEKIAFLKLMLDLCCFIERRLDLASSLQNTGNWACVLYGLIIGHKAYFDIIAAPNLNFILHNNALLCITRIHNVLLSTFKG